MKIKDLSFKKAWINGSEYYTAESVFGSLLLVTSDSSRRWSNSLCVGYFDTAERAQDACNAEHKRLILAWIK